MLNTRYKPLRPRNRQAIAPIMRKGGPHGKSTSAERAALRQELRQELRRELVLFGRDKSV